MKKLGFVLVFLFVCPSYAQISLPWSTTYNCSDWNAYSEPLNCDGMSKGLADTCVDGQYEQITAAANYPHGGGGKGQRHWLGDAVNDCTGGITLSVNLTEFYMRWYMRWQPGFKWSSYQGYKVIYLYDSSGGTRASGYLNMPEVSGNSGWNIDYYNERDSTHYFDIGQNHGWLYIHPNGQADGSWHCYEAHFKAESAGQRNGVYQLWLDGVLVADYHTVNYDLTSKGAYWKTIIVGSNQKVAANGRCMYVDYDDIAISLTGPIGPIGWGQNPPNTPFNVHLIP